MKERNNDGGAARYGATYPRIIEALHSLPVRSIVIDGEAVVCGKDGKSDFDQLHSGAHDAAVFLFAFDLIELDGEDIRPVPLEQRKGKLEKLLARSNGIQFSEHLAGDGATIFAHACKLGLEGIVSKRRDLPSGGRLGAMEGLSARLASLRVSRLTAGILLVLCFAAAYLFAAWLSGARDTTPLARICSRVDYVNGLQEQLEGRRAASEEVREQFKALVEECRAALSSRAEENDFSSPMTRREAITGLVRANTQNPSMIALVAFRRLASWATPTNLRLNAIP